MSCWSHALKGDETMALIRKTRGSTEIWAVKRPSRRYEEHAAMLAELVDKYAGILGFSGPSPHIDIADNLGSDWLGITELSLRDPTTTTITLQARILDDPLTCEKVLAHEMVHHWEMMSLGVSDLVRLKMGIKPPSHGESFHQGAAIINAVMGEGFVTVSSDKSYVLARNARPFYLLIVPTRGYVSARDAVEMPYGYAWAVRITPVNREKVDRVLAEGGKLIRTIDDQWTSGSKIQRWGKISIPKVGTAQAFELVRLFEEEPGVQPP